MTLTKPDKQTERFNQEELLTEGVGALGVRCKAYFTLCVFGLALGQKMQRSFCWGHFKSGEGHSATERLPTVKRPHGAEGVNANI